MPQIFRIGAYIVYFWANEGEPREPLHVHIAEGKPVPNATKIWITETGKALLCHNNSKFSEKKLTAFMRFIEANSETIKEEWMSLFGEVRYYC